MRFLFTVFCALTAISGQNEGKGPCHKERQERRISCKKAYEDCRLKEEEKKCMEDRKGCRQKNLAQFRECLEAEKAELWPAQTVLTTHGVCI